MCARFFLLSACVSVLEKKKTRRKHSNTPPCGGEGFFNHGIGVCASKIETDSGQVEYDRKMQLESFGSSYIYWTSSRVSERSIDNIIPYMVQTFAVFADDLTTAKKKTLKVLIAQLVPHYAGLCRKNKHFEHFFWSLW